MQASSPFYRCADPACQFHIPAATPASDLAEQLRKAYEPDDYADAFKGREPAATPAGGGDIDDGGPYNGIDVYGSLRQIIHDAYQSGRAGIGYTKQVESLQSLEPLIRRLASGGGAMPVMRTAFVTSQSCGPDDTYRLVFDFRSLAALQQAHREWITYGEECRLATAGQGVEAPKDSIRRMVGFIFRHFGSPAMAGELSEEMVADTRAVESWLAAPTPEPTT
jgi:hypothetical protein